MFTTRARNYYAAAVILFRDPSKDDCEIVIGLLEKALKLYSDFSDAQVLVQDVWHHFLTLVDPHNEFGTYKEKYLKSLAWKRKRAEIINRDEGKCVRCPKEGRHVHHETYDNIGREDPSDLILLCDECHNAVHQQQSETSRDCREAFIAYVKRKSTILKLRDRSGSQDYVNYETGYPTRNGFSEIQLSAWLPVDYNDVAALISIRSDSEYFQSHYRRFEKHESEIKDTFLFEDERVEFKPAGQDHQLRVVKSGVDLTQTADKDEAFPWLRENLEKLYWVLRMHDTLGT